MRLDALRIAEGECLPRGFGIAWWHHTTDTAIVLPIPLNWLLAWLRRGYLRISRGSTRTTKEQLERALQHIAWAYKDNARRHAAAEQDAYMRGRNDQRAATLRDFDNWLEQRRKNGR